MLREYPSPSQPADYLAGYDFVRHNEESKEVWRTWEEGHPLRTPMVLGLNARYFLAQEEANPDGVDFRSYTEDPDVMFETQLQFQRWNKFNLLTDWELGVPEKWQVYVDFQNYSEAAWFGCPLEFYGGQVPDTRPVFAACPEKVTEAGIPDPFGGILAKGLRYYEHFLERASQETFYGKPIEVLPCFTGSDGVMTIACNLFGPDFVCTSMATEPERLHRLLSFITEALIERMTAWRQKLGIPIPQEGFGYADDSIALISPRMYREHILPYHRQTYEALATSGPRGIHLCGDASRHFKTLQTELNIQTFDTGFPIDFGQVRKELGPTARIMGGPHIELLRTASPQEIRAEVRRICCTGILEGGLFILREGNNLAPGTPVENVAALYRAGREFGYQGR